MAHQTPIAFPRIAADLRQAPEYGKYMEAIGWKVEQIPSHKPQVTITVFVKKIGPGGLAKLQRFYGEPDWEALAQLAKREHLFMIKAEPAEGGLETWNAHGYRLDGWPLLGTKTLRVDLRPSQEKILAGFKKDCRYLLRKLQVTSHKPQINEFKLFYEIWKKSAKRKHLWIPGEIEYKKLISAFSDQVLCITIDNQAGCLVLIHEHTAFYYYAGSTAEGVQQNLPYAVVWQAMLEAKKRGCTTWDFEGIFDERWPNKGWKGFSHFKKSFSGTEIEYPGCVAHWRLPL